MKQNNNEQIVFDMFEEVATESIADTTPIQRQISCNIQNDKKLCVNANIYSI